MDDSTSSGPGQVAINSLLRRLWPDHAKENVTATEIALALGHIFTNTLSPVQAGALLTALHFTNLDRDPYVLASCARAMRSAAAHIDTAELATVVQRRRPDLRSGDYAGGLVDIVGTGGDAHCTFNISTTASVMASCLLLVAKHGNRASTSKSGSADVLLATQAPRPPLLHAITPATLASVYAQSNYAFLYAPVFHPGMRFVAPIRRQLGWRTIFNLLGPLSNPVDTEAAAALGTGIEARVIGVARKELGPAFAEALRQSCVSKALVVCGDEELDELSCAGPTHCWWLQPATTQPQQFTLTPADFGLSTHALTDVQSGQTPTANARVFERILSGQVARSDPLMEFVLMNCAALLVVSGVCEAESSSMGPGDDGQVLVERGPGGGRWKEGVRRAWWCVSSSAALREWHRFVEATHQVAAVEQVTN